MLKKTANLDEQYPDPEQQSVQQDLLLSLVGYNCRQAYLNIMPHVEKRLVKLKLRPVEFTILSLIKANTNISQKRLAQAANVSPPNLAPLLDKLEERGLVYRRRNPLDKRLQALALTTEGLSFCTKAEKAVVASEVEATEVLSDAEREQLVYLLQKLFIV